MLIDRKLATTAFVGAILTLLALVGVGFFLTFLSQTHNIGTGQFTASSAFMYAALTLPQTAWDMLPVAALIGALFALGALAANRELMILRVSGAGIWRLARAVAWAGLALAILTVILGEFIAPPAKRIAETQRVESLYAQAGTAGVAGLWLKSGQDIVHVKAVETPKHLTGLRIYTLAKGGGLAAVRTAASATFADRGWTLHDVRGTRFLGKHTERFAAAKVAWAGFVLPATFRILVVPPENLSWQGLAGYLAYLRANGLATARYETAFWHKIAVPVSAFLMVLLALPFALGRMRAAGAGQRLALGVVIGLVYYLVDRTVLKAGAAFHLAPLAAAWIPTAILAVVVLIALRTAR
jgi:lipopolysaccharide export system permease protein